MMRMCRHFACTRPLRGRTCTRSDLSCSTSPAEPDEVESGGRLRVTAPTTDEERAPRLRRCARHFLAPPDSSVGAGGKNASALELRFAPPLSPDGERARVRGEPLTWVAFEDADQRRASRSPRASTVRSTWRAAGAIARVSTPAGLSEQRKEARKAVFAGAPCFACLLWQDKRSKRPRGRGAGLGMRERKPARSALSPGRVERTASRITCLTPHAAREVT